MIEIKINKKESDIESIVVSGHANYDEYGSDIVCASVSSICITTVNAILSIDEGAIEYEEKSGFLKIEIKKYNDITNKLIKNMINLLKELEGQYKENIKIR